MITGNLSSERFLSISFTILSRSFTELFEFVFGKSSITADAKIEQIIAVINEKKFFASQGTVARSFVRIL